MDMDGDLPFLLTYLLLAITHHLHFKHYSDIISLDLTLLGFELLRCLV